jgi:hypothetical protein
MLAFLFIYWYFQMVQALRSFSVWVLLTFAGYLAMASHRHSALVTAPAAQSLAVHTEISVKVKVPDTINLLAGGYGQWRPRTVFFLAALASRVSMCCRVPRVFENLS